MSGSIASNVEHRLITLGWWTWDRQVGRFTFRTIHNEFSPIGKEMVVGASRRRYGATTEGTWLFRAYFDGVALYKKNLTENIINRYSCHNPIWEAIEKHYYTDSVINSESWKDEVIVLRRKPLSDYAQSVALQEGNLGDYLVRKYNIRGSNYAVV